MRDLIIIGAGPAGLAASSYALHKHLDTLVIGQSLGGKSNIRVDIPDAAGHRVIRAHEVVQSFRDSLAYLDYAWRPGKVTHIEPKGNAFALTARIQGSEEPQEFEARTVIVATGTRVEPLGVPGESTFQGKALGYSSISYSHLLADKTVFLVGNSQRTVDAAIELSSQAQKVALFLEQTGKYHDVYLSRLEAIENVELLEARRVAEFRGTTHAEEVVLELEDASTRVIRADAFFLERHPRANSGLVADLVNLDTEGRIMVDFRNRTSSPGMFAAGDVTNVSFEQILIALGEGAKAALAAYEQLVYAR